MIKFERPGVIEKKGSRKERNERKGLKRKNS